MRSNLAIALLCLILGAALADRLSSRDAHAQALPPSSGGGSDACTDQACTVTSLTSSGPIQGTTGSYSGAITSTVGSGNDAIVLQANAQIQDASNSTNWCRLNIAAKGAPEAIAELCHLDERARARLLEQVAALSEQGLRVLGVASAELTHGAEPQNAATSLPDHQHDFAFALLG